MSCCGGNCGCGDKCNCGSGCGGCKRSPDLSFGERTVAAQLVYSTATDMMFEDYVTVAGENGGCNCGSGCTCGPNCSCSGCSCCK